MIKKEAEITEEMKLVYYKVEDGCKFKFRNDGCNHPNTDNEGLRSMSDSNSSNYYICNYRVCPLIEHNRNGANE